jgi:hypothetical protein
MSPDLPTVDEIQSGVEALRAKLSSIRDCL